MYDDQPVQRSLLVWMLDSLGMMYAIILPLAGLICFLCALVLVLRGRGPMSAAALILVVHVPFLIGLFAAIQGGISSFTVIATSPSAPQPAAVAEGISTALFAPLVGMLVMVPGYLTAAVGAFFRSLGSGSGAAAESH